MSGGNQAGPQVRVKPRLLHLAFVAHGRLLSLRDKPAPGEVSAAVL